MKISKNTKTKKVILISSSIILLGAVLLGAYFYNQALQDSSQKAEQDRITKEQNKAGEAIKQQSLANDTQKPGTSGSDHTLQPTPAAGDKDKVTVTITAANQNDSLLQIRTLIPIIDSTGICTLKLTAPGYQPIEKSAATAAIASSSTCQGFDIPTSQLAKTDWNITLNYEGSLATGTATKTVTIK